MNLTFEPEYVPDAAECASLTAIVKMPGNSVQHRILKSVVDKFLVELRHANTEDEKQCVERVRRSQVAAEIYQLMVDKVNSYVLAYTIAEEATNEDVAPDATAEVLAMDYTTDIDQLVNFFDLEESANG